MGDAVGIPGMDRKIGDLPGTAGIHASQCICQKAAVRILQRFSQLGMSLYQLDPQCFRIGQELFRIAFMILGKNAGS